MRAELNWVAQTAAIITEALSSNQNTTSSARVNGGQGSAGAAEVSVVAEFWMGAAGGGGGGGRGGEAEGSEKDQKVVSVEIKPSAGGSDPPSSPPIRGLQPAEAVPLEGGLLEVAPPQTDCPLPQRSGIDCRAEQQRPS